MRLSGLLAVWAAEPSLRPRPGLTPRWQGLCTCPLSHNQKGSPLFYSKGRHSVKGCDIVFDKCESVTPECLGLSPYITLGRQWKSCLSASRPSCPPTPAPGLPAHRLLFQAFLPTDSCSSLVTALVVLHSLSPWEQAPLDTQSPPAALSGLRVSLAQEPRGPTNCMLNG